MPSDGRVEENCAELVRGGDVDLGRRCYDGCAVDHLVEIPDLGHPCHLPGRKPCLGNQVGLLGGGARQATARNSGTGWLVNRTDRPIGA
jgi:hypothetical protein